MANRVLLVTLLTACFSFGADTKAQLQGPELIAHAAVMQGIRDPGSKPFSLHMRIHAEHVVARPVDGVYQELWMAPEKWRREIAFPGFQQLELGDTDSKWLTRNLDFRPRAVYLTAIAIDIFSHPLVPDKHKLLKTRRKKVNGSELQCSELAFEDGRPSGELCFDDSGILSSARFQKHRYEYGDYVKFGDKIFPRSIRVFEEGRKVLEMSADDLAVPQDARAELFQHDDRARRMASCERWATWPSKKVAPHYPPDARAAHYEGTVVLYALLSADGQVEQTKVVRSAGSSLDEASNEAVRQWIYPPPTCGPVPLETEAEITVNYELQAF